MRVGIVSCILFLVSSVQAREIVESWTSVRALGMGNAYTAIVDDSDALFYNPAGLAKITSYNWTVLSVDGGINNLEAYNALKDATGDEEKMAEALKKLYGKNAWAGSHAKSAITVPGFGVAAYGAANLAADLRNPAYPNLELNYFVDYGAVVGMGVDLAPNILRFGLAAKRVTRTGTNLPIGPGILGTLESEELKNQLKNTGSAYGLDLGMVLTLPTPVKPTLSFVLKDMGYTTFKKTDGLAAPSRIEPEMIIGAALEIESPFLTLRPTFDYKHLNLQTEQIGKKIHIGVELSLPVIDIRAGFHQGYYTAGAGLDFGALRLNAATYGVEMGAYPGQREDRRYMAELTVELGFDPKDFKFSKSSGRRRLKQRR